MWHVINDTVLKYTLAVPKSPSSFLNNWVKNQLIEMISGTQNPDEILHKWFWFWPLYLKTTIPENVTIGDLPCEMQISCIWSKLHCFPRTMHQNSSALPHSNWNIRNKNCRNCYKCPVFVLTYALFSLPVITLSTILCGNTADYDLLTVRWTDVMCVWDGQRIPHAFCHWQYCKVLYINWLPCSFQHCSSLSVITTQGQHKQP